MPRRSWIRSLVFAFCSVMLIAGSVAIAVSPAWSEEPANSESAAVSDQASHRQTAIIQANVAGQPQTSLTCFCLTADDRILAGCAGGSGEIRVFDSAGRYVETWKLPVKPEAIFARADGAIFVAGEGEIAQLTPTGSIALQKKAPHAAALNENPEKLREQVVAQAKQRAELLVRQTEQFDQMIERSDKEIASLQKQIAALEQADEEAGDSDRRKQLLERRIAMHETRKEQYEAVKAQWARTAKQNPPAELTEEQIDQQVKASMAHKLKASSISATEDEVFLSTPAAAGYGFEIWRIDGQLENAVRIVSELRGCCGQMDVKANDNGLYVAENARHRVCRYDREGSLIGTWGKGARTGLEGFGSCCNPMNVAFGPDDVVYTAEDNTGRIKRYSPEGELLGLVGAVELVPGCKNVSIAVNEDGSQVYMLDITRHHIVRMDEQPAGESAGPADAEKKAAENSAEAAAAETPAVETTSSSGSGFRGLRAVFGSGD